MISLALPLPVTLNALTHNNNAKNGGKGGRSKTKRAKDWYKLAQIHVQPYYRQYKDTCVKNINELASHYEFKKKGYNLHKLHKKHPHLSYAVEYHYYFSEARHKLPRDIANYEKQLSDFLVDIGMILDDSFIDSMKLVRAGVDTKNPRVEVYIEIQKTTESE